MKKHRRVLVIAPHPDDETLGCGGSLLKHRAMGDTIYWLIVTAMKPEAGYTEERIRERQKEIDRVARAYRFSDVFTLNLPTTKLDKVPLTDIISDICKAIKKVKADTIYTPHAGDIHTDHQITHRAVMASTKSFRTPAVKKILAYETLSETEFATPRKKDAFLPHVLVDITPFIEKKLKIMKLYKDEVKRFPFPRSARTIKALATYRGSRMGARYAEAFMLIKEFVA